MSETKGSLPNPESPANERKQNTIAIRTLTVSDINGVYSNADVVPAIKKCGHSVHALSFRNIKM